MKLIYFWKQAIDQICYNNYDCNEQLTIRLAASFYKTTRFAEHLLYRFDAVKGRTIKKPKINNAFCLLFNGK